MTKCKVKLPEHDPLRAELLIRIINFYEDAQHLFFDRELSRVEKIHKLLLKLFDDSNQEYAVPMYIQDALMQLTSNFIEDCVNYETNFGFGMQKGRLPIVFQVGREDGQDVWLQLVFEWDWTTEAFNLASYKFYIKERILCQGSSE
ncbi:MAG: hypothetical protein FWC41_09580 [Firmicutes bacterium]|nr:hypothetical protein [Bacillota bacterium]